MALICNSSELPRRRMGWINWPGWSTDPSLWALAVSTIWYQIKAYHLYMISKPGYLFKIVRKRLKRAKSAPTQNFKKSSLSMDSSRQGVNCGIYPRNLAQGLLIISFVIFFGGQHKPSFIRGLICMNSRCSPYDLPIITLCFITVEQIRIDEHIKRWEIQSSKTRSYRH